MKTTKAIIVSIALLLLSFHSVLAVNGVQLSIQGNDVQLRWPSQPGQTFVIGYRPTLDASTPWTFLETAYAASQGAETTYVHPGVVVSPPPPEGGGGDALASSESKEARSWSEMTEEERAARREELYKQAQAAAEYLMALLKEAVAKAEADRERWKKEGFPSRDATATDNQPMGGGPDGPDPNPLGSTGLYFVTEYQEDPDGDGLPNGCEIYIGHNILKADTDGNGIPDGEEDSDSDGFDDLTECILGTDPLLPEDGDGQPLILGGVFSGQFDISFTPNAYANILGPYLDCNNGITADSLITTEPSPGVLRLNWHSVFIDSGGFAPLGGGPDGPSPKFTPEERNLLAAAFGHGTDIDAGIVSQPNQALIDQLPRDLLERYERVAVDALRENMELIQKVNTGQYTPPTGDTAGFIRRRIQQVHTQFTRLQAINKSLFQRFGRALNRILPFAGGIIILANAESIAANFLDAMNDYARDILNGDDETGSAAILAGECNNLAPGSGNIVLNYLLR